MGFDARALQLAVLAEGENVVANDVFAAVVLVVAAGFGVIDEIVLHRDAGAALVVVQAPAAAPEKVVRVNVVDDVVADRGAGRGAQGVYAAHIAQYAPANMMNVVELDLVVMCRTRLIAPAPADGNTCIAKIGNVVMRDSVVGATSNPHTYRTAVEMPA